MLSASFHPLLDFPNHFNYPFLWNRDKRLKLPFENVQKTDNHLPCIEGRG